MANTEPTRREFLKVTSAAAAAASLGIGGVTAPMLSCRLMPGDSPRSSNHASTCSYATRKLVQFPRVHLTSRN